MILKTPGYTLNEYKLVIPLPDALEHKIHGIRKDFGDQYRYKADPSRPHLTLASFSQLEMVEERIIQKLKMVSMAEAPFKVELKDFGSFPAHTIFIQVLTKEPLKKLVASCRSLQRLLRTDIEHKAHFITEPVISIGRKLKPWQYEKGWLEYTHRQFTGRFVADAMLLLKRREGSLHWQVAARFELQNLPIRSRQQELF